MQLRVLPDRLSVCKLPPTSEWPIPPAEGFYSATRTADELSIVCRSDNAPEGRAVHVEPNWRAFEVEGPLDFSLVGILSSLAGTLADAQVSIFAVSTYDTDYVLVRGESLETAINALTEAGHGVRVS